MERDKYKFIPAEATYDNWWNGDVTLAYSKRYFDENEKFFVVHWDDFSLTDVQKIKVKQCELFDEKVNDLLQKHRTTFIERYNNSSDKSAYYENEYQEYRKIIYGTIPNYNSNPIPFPISGKYYEQSYLIEIQNYINRTIINGIDDGLDFIHSPNCKYQDNRLPDSRIYARFVWEYFKWLELVVEKTIPQNPYPKIFTNYIGYQIFDAFRLEVITESNLLADFSYLYHALKKDEFIHDFTQRKFIDFLAENYGATEFAINNKQLKTFDRCSTPQKINAYSRIKKHFQQSNPNVL